SARYRLVSVLGVTTPHGNHATFPAGRPRGPAWRWPATASWLLPAGRSGRRGDLRVALHVPGDVKPPPANAAPGRQTAPGCPKDLLECGTEMDRQLPAYHLVRSPGRG